MTVTLAQPGVALAPQLHLTEAQRKAIADLRRDEELQTLGYRELQQKIEAQTEEAIRRLLDPQQLLAYDAMRKVQGDVQVLPMEDDGQLSGRRPGYLGIVGADAQGGGVQVSQVQAGTVAGYSGLQNGDVILEVNGERVTSYGDLAGKVRRSGEGGPVTLRIRRGTSEFYQGMQLGSRPP
jgi:C-terminal processing protease CtpA/Prc